MGKRDHWGLDRQAEAHRVAHLLIVLICVCVGTLIYLM